MSVRERPRDHIRRMSFRIVIDRTDRRLRASVNTPSGKQSTEHIR